MVPDHSPALWTTAAGLELPIEREPLQGVGALARLDKGDHRDLGFLQQGRDLLGAADGPGDHLLRRVGRERGFELAGVGQALPQARLAMSLAQGLPAPVTLTSR